MSEKPARAFRIEMTDSAKCIKMTDPTKKNFIFFQKKLDDNLFGNIFNIVMNTNMKIFKKLLNQHEIRPTHQRLVILDYMSKHRTHPTVDDIYEAIKDHVATISKTTVYNTLHTFIQKGLVRGLLITANEVHYDINSFPHHHLLCTECGEIYDIPSECCCHSTGIVNGHKITDMQGYFMGVCKKCLANSKEKDNGS